MPLIKRFFHIPCRGDECFKLAELISEKAPAVNIVDLEISDDGLYIEMYGYKSEIKNAWEYIRRIVSAYRSSIKQIGRGLRRIKVEFLVEKTRKTFPPVLLVSILKYRGFKAELSVFKDEIITNASLEEIEDLVGKIWEYMNKIRYDARGVTTKYFVIAASILTNKDPERVMEEALHLNILYRDEDGKYRLRIEWRKAISEYIDRIGKSYG